MDIRLSSSNDQDLHQSARLTQLALDGAIAIGCGLLAALYALSFFAAWNHHIPIDDVYFGADPHRIVANLSSTSSDFRRTPFHPFFAALCALFAATRGTSSMTVWLGWGSCLYGMLVGSMTYVTARLWGAAPVWSFASVVLVAGSGAFATFSSVPEAHAWGGVSVLACLLIARLLPAGAAYRTLAAGALVPVAVSMVFTNFLIWPLCVAKSVGLPFTRLGPILKGIRKNALVWIAGMVIGLTLLELLFALELKLFVPNQTLGHLFHFSHDNKYLLAGGHHNPLGGLLSYGIIAPVNRIERDLGMILALATLILCTINWQRADAVQWVRLVLPAIAFLHTVYDRREAFMCSPNYCAVVSILIMITLSRHATTRLHLILVGAALLMIGTLNWFAVAQLRESLTASQTFIPL